MGGASTRVGDPKAHRLRQTRQNAYGVMWSRPCQLSFISAWDGVWAGVQQGVRQEPWVGAVPGDKPSG